MNSNQENNQSSFNSLYNSLNKTEGLFSDANQVFFPSETNNQVKVSTIPKPAPINQELFSNPKDFFLDAIDETLDEVDTLNQNVNTSFNNVESISSTIPNVQANNYQLVGSVVPNNNVNNYQLVGNVVSNNQPNNYQPVINNQVDNGVMPVTPVTIEPVTSQTVQPTVVSAQPEVVSQVVIPQSINVSNIGPVVPNNINTVNNSLNTYNNQARVEELKQKENNQAPIVYNDGIDEDDSTGGIRAFLTNRKIILPIAILAFICVCIVVAKAFYFGKKVDHYEEVFTEIVYKEDTMAKAYEGKEIDSQVLKKVAATELISCINAKVDVSNLPSSVTSIINEINSYYNQSYNYFAFKYKDIYTGFTVSYNENQNIFTASTIKAPTDIYLWEMASLDKINLDEEMTYTGHYYNSGSGVLKSKPLNTKYTVRTLLDYSTIYSDNAAHNMLMDRYGRENMLKFWQELGTTAIFTQRSNWGVTNAHDATIYMEELYRFYLEDEKYGEKLMSNFMNTTTKFLSAKNGNGIANKIGWSGSTMHDAAIIFADNPYIVIALSNLGDTGYYTSYFNKASDFAYRLHTEYWKYKMSMCGDIKQY